MSSEASAAPTFVGRESDGNSRGWMTIGGIMLLAAGTGAIVYSGTATNASVFVFGWLAVLAGVMQMMHAYHLQDSSWFVPDLLDAIVRATIGAWLMLYPASSTEAVTLLLCYYFTVAGLFRAFVAFELQFQNWRWSAASGLAAVALAILLSVQWPISGRLFIGIAIGIDLILYGLALLMYAAAKNPAPSYT